MPHVECPNCGAAFRAGRLACPECGSDAETGWKSPEDIDYMSVDIPDSWDEATGELDAQRPTGAPGWVAAVLVVTLVAFALSFVLRLW